MMALVIYQPMATLFFLWAVVAQLVNSYSQVEACDCHPLSLIYITCQVLDRIIRDTTTIHLYRQHLLHDAQQNFKSRCSCLTCWLSTLKTATQLMDDDEDVYICFLDFSRVFHIANHRFLCAKLANLLLQVHCIKGLGGILDYSLSPSARIDALVTRAKGMLAFLDLTFRMFSPSKYFFPCIPKWHVPISRSSRWRRFRRWLVHVNTGCSIPNNFSLTLSHHPSILRSYHSLVHHCIATCKVENTISLDTTANFSN